MKSPRSLAWFLAALFVALFLTSGAVADPSPGLPPPSPAIDRSTPRRSLDAYLQATRNGDYARAAYLLDLRSIATRDHATEGPVLARRLKLILDASLFLDVEGAPDTSTAGDEGTTGTLTLGSIRLGVSDQPIQLRRVSLAGSDAVWVFSSRTVQAIPTMYDALGHGALGERMPKFLTRSAAFGIELWQWLGLGIALVLAALFGRLLSDLVLRGLLRLTVDANELFAPRVLERLRTPTRLAIGTLSFYAIAAALHLPSPARAVVTTGWKVLISVTVVLYVFRLIDLVSAGIEHRAVVASGETATTTSAARVRGVRTQVRLLRRVLHVVVVLVGIAIVLMQFEGVRSVGVSLLAASGAAGIVLGLAAQRSLSSFFAGIQLSFTQPIRIGDTVVVEGQFGEVEEITLSYVAIKTWDQRRFIVPIAHFLEKPFENWTRGEGELLGTAFLYADYTVPVDLVREELSRYIPTNAKWDGKVARLQVTDATDRAVVLRALVSAHTPDDVFSLRHDVREHLIGFLQRLEGGRYLPKTRTLGDGASAATSAQ